MMDFEGWDEPGERTLDDVRIGRLERLPREADPGRDLWPGIAAEIAGDAWGAGGSGAAPPGTRVGRGPGRFGGGRWVQAAAAVAIFALGGIGGWAVTRPSDPPEASIDQALALAAEVQRTGSEYVAALAAFVSVVDSLSGDVRSQGRDAAIATLYGASRELVALEQASPRADERSDGPRTPIRF
jgi:hypothetical protein